MKKRIILSKLENLMAAIKQIKKIKGNPDLGDGVEEKIDVLLSKFNDVKPTIKKFRKKVKSNANKSAHYMERRHYGKRPKR